MLLGLEILKEVKRNGLMTALILRGNVEQVCEK